MKRIIGIGCLIIVIGAVCALLVVTIKGMIEITGVGVFMAGVGVFVIAMGIIGAASNLSRRARIHKGATDKPQVKLKVIQVEIDNEHSPLRGSTWVLGTVDGGKFVPVDKEVRQ